MPTLPQIRPRVGTGLLLLLLALSLLAGLGLRQPMPPDEPRFALAARQMVESGQWLFPHRGSELYAEKPPMFMWLQAASHALTGHWRVAFLLPSLLSALLVLWLCGDLARRLWGRWAVPYAVFGLFACLQFGLQAKRAQIDMVLVGMTTLSLWALLRYLLERRASGGSDPRLLALGTFAAGLGTVTKGVGFLPLLVFLPWLWARAASPRTPPSHRGAHVGAGVGGFLLGAGVWLLPMLWAALSSQDPALQKYAHEMLFKQTGTRYANAWHHVKPAWYYLQVMATLWLPGALLAPWLLPAWWRRVRRGDARFVLLPGWSLLVLLFFSASPGKREVYLFPMLPALCVTAAPLLPALLRRAGVRRVLWAYLGALALAALGLGLWLSSAPPQRLQSITEGRGLDMAALSTLAGWLLGFGIVAIAVTAAAAWKYKRQPAVAVVLVTVALWTAYGLGLMPALSPDSSAQALMQRVGARIGPDAELAMLGWREQHLLQADRRAVDFGFKKPWVEQWQQAHAWLQASPRKRWLFLRKEAIGPCLDPERVIDVGSSNRRAWILARGDAWLPGCEVPADWSADVGED